MFSVVIPTYNRLHLLRQAVSSVLAQNHRDFEVIVVDDGSNDGTMEYLESLSDPIKALRQTHRGPGAARNLGVKHATGKYVAFLDSDDIWLPWTLESFHEIVRTHREPSLISASTIEFQGKLPEIERGNLVVESFFDFFETATDAAYVGSGAMVIKRDVFDGVGGFDETLCVGEDLDFYFRVGTAQNFVRVISPITLAYRRHTNNVSIGVPLLYSAATVLLDRESEGSYPGGEVRKRERRVLLSRMIRPVTLSCLTSGQSKQAWKLYRQSVFMNVSLMRFRFLIGFLLYALYGGARGIIDAMSCRKND